MNKLTRNTLKRSLSIHSNKSRLTNFPQIKQRLSSSMIRTNQTSIVICLIIIGLMLLVLPLSSFAAISTTTSKTIQGNPPLFDFKGDKNDPLSYLLKIQYTSKNGDKNIWAGPIQDEDTLEVQVHADMKENELKVRLSGVSELFTANIALPLINSLRTTGSELTIYDSDGDAINYSVKGKVSAILYKDGAKVEPSGNIFDPCSTYQLKVAVEPDEEDLFVETQYGTPSRSLSYDKRAFTYNIKSFRPNACYARPEMTTITATGGGAEWDSIKGFKRQSITNASKNFPTTGFDYAYFNLTLEGVNAKDVIFATTTSTGLSGTYRPAGSAVFVELSAANETTNILRVTLRGPHDADNHTMVPKHVPTQFDLKSSIGDVVYSFQIKKWFIAKPGGYPYSTGSNETLNYCAGFGSAGDYAVPSVNDYTNANGNGWTGIYPSNPNNYQRTIGQGLFSEWGSTHNGYYTNSAFEQFAYWANASDGSGNQYVIHSLHGTVGYSGLSYGNRAACISP